MGLATVVSGADFSALNIGNTLFPVVSGLEVLHYLGGTAAASQKNLVSGGTDSTIVGTPTVNANDILLNNTSGSAVYFSNASVLATEFTVIQVVKGIQGNIFPFSVTTEGTWFDYDPISARTATLTSPPATGVTTSANLLTLTDSTKWGFLALRRSNTQAQLSQGVGGIFSTATMPLSAARSGPSTNPTLFGAFPTAFSFGTGPYTYNCSCIAKFNRVLTDVEMAKAYAGLQAIYARRAITL